MSDKITIDLKKKRFNIMVYKHKLNVSITKSCHMFIENQ